MKLLSWVRPIFYWTYDRPRRNLFIFAIVMFILITYWYLMSAEPEQLVRTNSLEVCMNDLLESFNEKLSKLDALFLTDDTSAGTLTLQPMIGNGLFGCNWHKTNARLMLQFERSLSWKLEDVNLLVDLEMLQYTKRGKLLLDIVEGTLHQFDCFQLSQSICLGASLSAYAHRRRTNILVQTLKLFNPSNENKTIQLVKSDLHLWKGSATKPIKISLTKNNKVELVDYTIFYKLCSHQNAKRWVLIVRQNIPSVLSLPQRQHRSLSILTGVFYLDAINVTEGTSEPPNFADYANYIAEYMSNALSLSIDALYEEHSNVWTALWHSGLHVSQSLAPNALNGAQINSTIYYILSHHAAPLHRWNITRKERSQYSEALWAHDRCYNGHDTFHAKSLWSIPDHSDIDYLVTTWMLTLEKQGCGRLIQAGVDGIMQAIVLSLGGFKFSEHHLEFSMHPNDLHRHFHFRGLRYDSATALRVHVDLDEDNRPGLWIAIDTLKPGNIFFACDAACHSGPIALKKSGIDLSIRLTKPFTALLYISDNEQHLNDLRQTVHVREIHDVQPHNDDIIAIHRHGHALGGLPLIFWFIIGLLVILFHVCLCHLMYQEYCIRGEGSVSSLPAVGPHSRYPAHHSWYASHHDYKHQGVY